MADTQWKVLRDLGATGGLPASVIGDSHWLQAASGTHQNTLDAALG